MIRELIMIISRRVGGEQLTSTVVYTGYMVDQMME